MIKLIASDMDGTLLNDKMAVSDRNIEAIKNAQKAGIEFLIATGRSIEEARPFLKDRVHPGFITLNGAEVYDDKEQPISSNPLSEDSKNKVIEYFHKHNMYFLYYMFPLFCCHGKILIDRRSTFSTQNYMKFS